MGVQSKIPGKPILNIKSLQLRSPSWLITLLVSAYLLTMFNGRFFNAVNDLHGADGISGLIYIGCLFIFLLIIINLCLTLLAIPWVLKPALIFLLIASSVAYYFMDAYNVLIDKTMIQNAMETDFKESSELFSSKLLVFVFLTGVIPAVLLWRTNIDYGNPFQFFVSKLVIGAVSIGVIGIVAILFYQDYASMFRNNRYVRDLIVPVNYIHGFNSYAKTFFPQNTPDFQSVGLDAHFGDNWNVEKTKRVVTVLVVGETARSANFSLYGYQRKTNPKLEQADIISFSQVSSCGTSTAVSLPCMFSKMGRGQFDDAQARYSENFLDVLQRAGLEVVWIENNSGCKGVCNRIGSREIIPESNPELCQDGGCHDMVLVEVLNKAIETSNENIVVVLHQSGSHGPAYFLRAPEEFQRYKPFCHTNQLQECSRQEIINAYDNTILYTDHVLSEVINLLKSKQSEFDASMLYVSDHGESLGEGNLYLHGLPYMLAPEEQTHVPMVLWLGDNFASRFSIDKTCLQGKAQESLSHDNLFDSMIGMLDIKTSVYSNENDIFNSCRSRSVKNISSEMRATSGGLK